MKQDSSLSSNQNPNQVHLYARMNFKFRETNKTTKSQDYEVCAAPSFLRIKFRMMKTNDATFSHDIQYILDKRRVLYHVL
ncbi:hypothetical protein EUGRSUZ_G00616 [Eucalyptus grandis]|uniref:Uncharacterized protein n=2 Tax=Eucalyptus grandis TaxID=71139 RepID=A0ACC3K0X5_EUCGR|nr:hypothetical protein EUGRSUZ_G00616 [Eucalyptus grandis]